MWTLHRAARVTSPTRNLPPVVRPLLVTERLRELFAEKSVGALSMIAQGQQPE